MRTLLQRFRRLAEEEVEEPDADWAASDANDDDSDDESHDGTFKPIYAFWAKKGMVPAKNMRGGGKRRPQARPAAANAGRKRRMQVIGCYNPELCHPQTQQLPPQTTWCLTESSCCRWTLDNAHRKSICQGGTPALFATEKSVLEAKQHCHNDEHTLVKAPQATVHETTIERPQVNLNAVGRSKQGKKCACPILHVPLKA